MITPKMVDGIFQRNLRVIKMQIEGLTDDDALTQVPFRGNCLNWVLGHLVVSRQAAFRYFNLPEQTGEHEKSLYGGGSVPITPESPNIPPMSKLMEWMDESETIISDHLATLTESDMESQVGEGDRKGLLGDKLEFLVWHEAYHVGQTEYLRQLAGTDDKVI